MSSARNLVDYMRRDLAQYVRLYPRPSATHSPDTLRVILSSPGLLVVLTYRLRSWLFRDCENIGMRVLGVVFGKVCSLMWIIFMKIQIAGRPEIGPGLYLSSKGYIILGATKLGAGCVIQDRVSIGMDKDRGRPEVGDNVMIGPDTVIYGNVKVGNGSVILGGTVLGKSVPDHSLVGGKPGRILRRNVDYEEYIGELASIGRVRRGPGNRCR